jgi:hypothetical protein
MISLANQVSQLVVCCPVATCVKSYEMVDGVSASITGLSGGQPPWGEPDQQGDGRGRGNFGAPFGGPFGANFGGRSAPQGDFGFGTAFGSTFTDFMADYLNQVSVDTDASCCCLSTPISALGYLLMGSPSLCCAAVGGHGRFVEQERGS